MRFPTVPLYKQSTVHFTSRSFWPRFLLDWRLSMSESQSCVLSGTESSPSVLQNETDLPSLAWSPVTIRSKILQFILTKHKMFHSCESVTLIVNYWLNKERPTWCHLLFLFYYLMLNLLRMLIHPSSGACDLFVELFHGLYCFGTMRVGVTFWFGWGGLVSGCRLQHA
jgi:hypothetical protein